VDVAYDAGKPGAAKRTAEVVVRGHVNGEPFSVTRRRGSKKGAIPTDRTPQHGCRAGQEQQECVDRVQSLPS